MVNLTSPLLSDSMARPSLYHEVAAQYKTTLDGQTLELVAGFDGSATPQFLETCRSSMPSEPVLCVGSTN
jgi:hypothetical protein